SGKGGSLRALFFEQDTLYEFNRPILNKQYHRMRDDWPKALEACEYAALKDLGPELQALIQVAAAAIKRKSDLEADKKIFRDVGDRAMLFDNVNNGRRQLWVDLSELVTNQPSLPGNFPDRFYRRDTVEGEIADEEPTVESLEVEIEALLTQVE